MSSLNLGPFTVGPLLGTGAMGTVFAAVHRPTGTAAAVKALRARYRGQRQRTAFRHEVERMAALDHPRIVAIFDHGVVPDMPLEGTTTGSRLQPGAPYLVMARAAHGSLADNLRRLDWPSAAAVLGGVLDGLAHAHARGLVHCDLKPENVLLARDADGIRPQLADFGVSHAFREADRIDALGTPPFMAPEQFHQPRDIGPWTDLYALGCLAWMLVCHAQPYTAASPVAYAIAHTTGPLPDPEPALVGVPDAMADWLRTLISRDWRARFRSAAAARAALARFAPLDADIHLLDGSGVDATADTVVETEALTATVDRAAWRPVSDAPPPLDPHPPLPADWRPPRRHRPRPLEGVGRALFGLRVPPFTGRDAERDRIWSALRDVDAHGARRLVVLRGAAGTGKSRLARWALERADELGAALPIDLRHHRAPLPGDGLVGALHRLIRPTGGDGDRARITRLRGAGEPEAIDGVIARLCTDRLDGPTLPPGRRFEAATACFVGAAAGRALVLLVDDAQWGADAVAFADRLLDDGPPCLVLLTVRSDLEASPAVERLLADRGGEVIDLPPLDAATHRALVRRLLPLDPETTDRVVERTAGHPLFAVQLLGEWLRRGALVAGDRGFVVTADAADAVPASLPALWGPTLDELSGDERLAVEIGAALGARVDGGIWRAACAAGGVAPPLDLLDRLARAGLVRSERDGWRFGHGLLRDTVLALVASDGRRQRLHRACARALEAVDGRRAPSAMTRIAEHWIAAGLPAEALGPLRSAAWLLIDRMHRDPVRPIIARHDALLDEMGAADDDPRRARSGVLRAFLAFADADLELTRALFDRCRAGVEQHGLESERGRMLRLRGMMARQVGDRPAAERLLRAAEVQCVAAGLIVEAGKAALGRAEVHRRDGDRAACRAAIDTAVQRFDEGGDDFWRNTARMEKVRLLRFDGHLDEAAALALDIVERARSTGDEANEARGQHTYALIRRLLRDLSGAERALSAAQAIYRRTKNINGRILDGERAMLVALDGRIDDAAALAARSDAALAGTMWADGQPCNCLFMALGALRRGDRATAEAHLERFRGVSPPRNRSDADAAEWAAGALTDQGHPDLAVDVAAWAAASWRAVGDSARAAAIEARFAARGG